MNNSTFGRIRTPVNFMMANHIFRTSYHRGTFRTLDVGVQNYDLNVIIRNDSVYDASFNKQHDFCRHVTAPVATWLIRKHGCFGIKSESLTYWKSRGAFHTFRFIVRHTLPSISACTQKLGIDEDLVKTALDRRVVTVRTNAVALDIHGIDIIDLTTPNTMAVSVVFITAMVNNRYAYTFWGYHRRDDAIFDADAYYGFT
jgi:hypothetical protein